MLLHTYSVMLCYYFFLVEIFKSIILDKNNSFVDPSSPILRRFKLFEIREFGREQICYTPLPSAFHKEPNYVCVMED